MFLSDFFLERLSAFFGLRVEDLILGEATGGYQEHLEM
jgi:hypothetical protein